jgi:hypothetical protein
LSILTSVPEAGLLSARTAILGELIAIKATADRIVVLRVRTQFVRFMFVFSFGDRRL